MISNMTCSIDREVTPCQQRFKASADTWLSLAAAPTFAILAVLTGVLGGGQPDILCLAADHASPLSGMIPMYLLMSAFHSPPWLKLIFSRGNGTRRVFPQPRARTADPFNVCGRPLSARKRASARPAPGLRSRPLAAV